MQNAVTAEPATGCSVTSILIFHNYFQLLSLSHPLLWLAMYIYPFRRPTPQPSEYELDSRSNPWDLRDSDLMSQGTQVPGP